MLSFSRGLILSALGIGGIGNVMNGGVIRIFSGLRPVNASAAVPPSSAATVLGKVTMEGRTFYADTDPEQAGLQLRITDDGFLKSYGRWVLRVTKTGTPTWFRWTWGKTDNDDDSFYYPRIDGWVTAFDVASDEYSAAIENVGIVLPVVELSSGQEITLSEMKMWFKDME